MTWCACWSSYRANGLGQADPLLTPHPVYAGLGAKQADRLAAYRALFSPELDTEAIADIRLVAHSSPGNPGGLR